MVAANFINRRQGYDKSSRTIEDKYQVEVDVANDQSAAIAAVEAKSVPYGYVTESIQASHINRNPMWYEVNVTYKLNPAGGVSDDDPLSRPSILSASYEEWTEAYDIDNSDTPKPVVNSAGDPFQTYPQRRNGSLILQITKNIASYAAIAYDAIKFTTNANAVSINGTTYAADTLLYLPPTVQEVWEQIGANTHHYYNVTFRLAADAGKHLHKVADRGYRQLLNGKLVPILDGYNAPTEDPWPLNGTGWALGPQEVPATLTFKPYASVAWNIDFS